MWRAALTELVATATLMFILTSCIISCLDSHVADPKLLIPFIVFAVVFLFLMVTVPLSGGHMSPIFTFIAALKGIISCLDSQVADPKLLIPFIVFAVVFLFLMVTVPLSGGHMSPIFTFIAALKGIISLTRAASYVVAQCIGSVMGFMVVKCVMSHEKAVKYSLGGCTVVANGAAPGLEPATALVLEFACTFVVLFVAVTVAFDHRRCVELGLTTVCAIVAGIMGLVVFVSVTVTGRPAYAGVGLNPARCLGPAILYHGRLWEGHWVFWVGPFFGCVVYYGYSRNIPDGLVMGDGEFDFVNLVGRLVGK